MEQPSVPGYDVLARLGGGATSTVWRARRHADGLIVALKVLTPAHGDVAAGLREASLLAGLRHRHLIHLYDVLPLPDPRSGLPAAVVLSTELAGGGSLAQVLGRRRILSPGELVTVLHPIADVVAELHQRGVVHGDLSVGNILFLTDGMPMLADLGAGRITGHQVGPDGLVGTGAQDGMVAPEVLEGFAPTQESDVYQLGALAWLSLAGQPPGPAYARTDLAEIAPTLPEGLVDLVRRALAGQPEDRPDAEELALALMATAVPEPVEVAPDADPGHGLTQRLRQQAVADLESAEEVPRRRLSFLRGRRRTDVGAGAHRPERVGGQVGDRASRRSTAPRGSESRGLVLVGVVGLAALLVVVTTAVTLLAPGLVPWASSATSQSQATTVRAVQAVDIEPVDGAGSDASDDADPEADQAAASSEDLVATLQTLVDRRGQAWEDRDADLLDGSMAPGSPALAQERVELERAEAAGLSFPDVTFRVEEAEVVKDGPERLEVRATVSRAPLTGTGADGQHLLTEEMRTDEVHLELAQQEGEWLLWSWG